MPEALSPRQIECLNLLKSGNKSKTIAYKLKISIHTVNQHVREIYRRLDVRTRAEAVAEGIRLEII
jgi:DNA-binding CsgD family transcriptional regulator